MNKKALFMVLVIAAVLLATPYVGIVFATPPSPILFGAQIDTLGGTFEFRQAGNNWICHGSTYCDFIGDIEGSMTAQAYWIFHNWVGPVEDPFMLEIGSVNGHVLLTIEAIVDGKMGTIQLRFNAVTSDSGGTWVIYGGTDELKGLHGYGNWYSYGVINGVPCQVFEGQIHFEP